MAVKGLKQPTDAAVRSEAPPMKRIEPSPVYELVVERIRRAIHIGSYVPGDRLPPERALAEQLGVSRTTVREAIRVLEGEGYVESRRGATGGVILLDRGQTEERLGPIKSAVQPGRLIATLEPAAGLTPAVAFMDGDPSR